FPTQTHISVRARARRRPGTALRKTCPSAVPARSAWCQPDPAAPPRVQGHVARPRPLPPGADGLEPVPLEDLPQDHLALHQCEGGTDAAAGPAAEGQPRGGRGDVVEEASRIELL